MHTDTTTITNATTGQIIILTRVHRVGYQHWPALFLVLALILISSGLYLLLRAEKTK